VAPQKLIHRRRYSLSILLLVFIVVVLIISISRLLSNPQRFPVKNVKIESSFIHVSKAQLQQLILPSTRLSFYALNLSQLRRHLLIDPWIASVDISRIWPNTVQIIINEQTPIAQWNNNGLINQAGKIFYPKDLQNAAKLPQLFGLASERNLVLSQFTIFKRKLATVGAKMQSLTLSPRNSWTLVLANGTSVDLGRINIEQHLQRLLAVYPILFKNKSHPAISIDMRYPNGLAVHWGQIIKLS